VTSSLVVFEAAIRVKSTHLIKVMFEKQKKKRKYGSNFFYINLHLRDPLDRVFTACYGELMPEEAPTSFTVSDAYRKFVSQA